MRYIIYCPDIQNLTVMKQFADETTDENIALQNQEDIKVLKHNIDDLFHITMGCFVFFMQPGFAFLEAGSVR